jgi:phosphatidylethanolamine-binding protein (PEBP) family uncharacterized protein
MLMGLRPAVLLVLPLLGLPALPLSSPAIDGAGRLARDCTCAGKGETPPLAWGTPPPLTRSLAIVVEDPEVPGRANWMVYNLPPGVRGLTRGAGQRNGVPPPALASVYEAPCATWPGRRVRVRVFAVDGTLPNRQVDYGELKRLLAGHLLAFGEIQGFDPGAPARRAR